MNVFIIYYLALALIVPIYYTLLIRKYFVILRYVFH